MKHSICVLMLLVSISGATIAQENQDASNKIFDLPGDFAQRRFTIDIGSGNKMIIELNDPSDIARFMNMDSLLKVFLNDIEPFKDKLGSELNSKKVDYIIDPAEIKKIRIQQFPPKGSSFTIIDGAPASLKLDQDTVNMTGVVRYRAKHAMRKEFMDIRYYRISYFLNDINDIERYTDGRLNEKLVKLMNNINSPWKYAGSKSVVLKNDPSVSAFKPKGYVAGGDYLNIRVSVDLQNYKSYFVPSFSVGAGLIWSSGGYFKHEIVASWDPNFLFAKNSQGELKTFRNDFVTLTFGQGRIKDQDPHKESHLLFVASLSYLVHRNGELFDKNTFRLGAGRLSLFEGKTKIEPVLYFNNFFKSVTPGVRLIQSF